MLTFSVVIPTYNRPSQLRGCLEALADQDYPQTAFEVIVVDDGSTESLRGIDDLFRAKLSLVFLRQQNAGPASARNTGAQHAKGRYIAFTDDDCVPARDWLRRLADNLDGQPDQLCGGRVLNSFPENVFSVASQIIMDVVYEWQKTTDAPRFFTTNNLSVPARRFVECGGLDPLFRCSEDREFCDRWTHNGGVLRYAPEAVVYHKRELNFWTFVQQHFNFGRGAFRFYLLRAQRGWGHLRVDPHFYLGLLHHSVNRPLRQSLSVLGAIFVSQLANVGGYFWERLLRSFSRVATAAASQRT